MASLVLSDGTRSYDFLAEPAPAIYVQQDGLVLPVVSREDTFAEGSDSEGRSRVRSRALNSEAGSFSVYFKATNATDFWDAVDNLQELVESAHRNKGTLTYTPPGGVAVTFDLEAISVTDLPQRGVMLRAFHGEATVSFESKPYGRLAEVNIGGYLDYALTLNPSILLALDATNGVTDLSGNGRNGTGAGGITVGGYSPGPLAVGDDGATDFDGTDDRITTTYATRRNVWVNPSFETNITGIANSTCTTARSSTQAKFDTYSCQVTSTGAGAAPNTSPAISTIAATAGTTYTFSFYLYHTVAGRQGRADLRFYDASNVLIGSGTVGTAATATQNTWTRFSVTATAPAGTAKVGFVCRCDVTSAGSSGEVSYIDGLLIEAASSAGTYFPTVAQLDTGEAGWTGAAHASASEVGPFSNGTSRTFMGWLHIDAPGAGGFRTIWGNGYGAGYDIVLQVDADTGAAATYIGTTSYAFAGTPIFGNAWHHYAVVINEPANTISLYRDGFLIETISSAGAQWASGQQATQKTFNLGDYSGQFFDGKQQGVAVYEYALTADEINDLYGAGASAWSFNGPVDDIPVYGVPGQVSAWGDLTLTDADSVARNHVEVGVQHDYDPDNPEPLLLQAVVDLDAQGGSSNTRSGSYSTNILRAALTTSPVAVCTSGEQPHKGLWKVRARVYPSATDVRVRLAWRAGDGPFAAERWVRVPSEDDWYDLDLGTINIPELPSGHVSEFRVEAAAASGVPTLDVDFLALIPADNYTKLRGATSEDTPTAAAVAAEDFSTHSSAALAGTTPLLAPSGTWTASGTGSGTFYTTAGVMAYSEASGDSSLTTDGVFARLGSGTLTDGYISARIATDHREYLTGVFARYSATNNWLMAGFTKGTFGSRLVTLIKNVAGSVTTISSVATNDDYIYLFATATGYAGVLTSVDGNSWTWRILTTSADAAIATAGGIASGGYGLYHACTDSSVSSLATFQNIAVVGSAGVTSVSNPAMNAGHSTELTHETALTTSADNTSTTPIREGRYLTLPPATRNDTKSRVVVKARRNDSDLGLPDTGLTDDLTGTLTVTPRVHLTGN